MTQPSVLDREFTRQPNILFPARSSPLVCAADALEIIVRPLFLVVIKRQSLGNAARFTRLQRFPDAVESVWQLYPWASLISFLATSTQAVKIFGFTGPCIIWVKVAAGAYVGSYVVLASLSLLPYSPEEVLQRENKQHLLGRAWFFRLITGAHMVFTCWAIFQVAHIRDFRDESSSIGEPLAAVLSALLLLFEVTIAYMGLSVFVFCIAIACLYVCSVSMFLGTVFALVLCIGIWKFLLYLGDLFWICINIANWIVQGGGLLFLGFLFFLVLNFLKDKVCRRATSLWSTDPLVQSQVRVVGFAVMNLVAVCLYYRFAYDSRGTVKPTWTEKLGWNGNM